MVDSPDFAAAVSTYRKASATALNATASSPTSTRTCCSINGVAQREAEQAETDAVNAEADRDAALQALVSLNVDPRPSRTFKKAGRSPISAAHPRADRGNRGGKTDHARTAAPGGHHAVLHGRRSVARVGAWRRFRLRPCVRRASAIPPRWIPASIRQTFTGTVDNISALVNPDTRSVVARVVVENPATFSEEADVCPRADPVAPESTGLLVPVSAILRDDENLPFVYVAQPTAASRASM
jgi:cobalt-zinc-cadmium efflux system membrane fusion protein